MSNSYKKDAHALAPAAGRKTLTVYLEEQAKADEDIKKDVPNIIKAYEGKVCPNLCLKVPKPCANDVRIAVHKHHKTDFFESRKFRVHPKVFDLFGGITALEEKLHEEGHDVQVVNHGDEVVLEFHEIISTNDWDYQNHMTFIDQTILEQHLTDIFGPQVVASVRSRANATEPFALDGGKDVDADEAIPTDVGTLTVHSDAGEKEQRVDGDTDKGGVALEQTCVAGSFVTAATGITDATTVVGTMHNTTNPQSAGSSDGGVASSDNQVGQAISSEAMPGHFV